MTCKPAPSCRGALDEATFLWPERRTASDGTCASAAHHAQNPGSDHEPNRDGYATAFDLTDDKAHGCDADRLVELLRLSRDPRVKYVIAESRMYSSYPTSSCPAWEWRPYNGPNPHTSHVHVSILPAFIQDHRQWWSPLMEDDMTPGQEAKLDRCIQLLEEAQPLLAAMNHQTSGTFASGSRLARAARAADHYNKQNGLTT